MPRLALPQVGLWLLWGLLRPSQGLWGNLHPVEGPWGLHPLKGVDHLPCVDGLPGEARMPSTRLKGFPSR